MIPCLIHATILLTLSYLFYRFFLKKETFYRLNRVFLVTAFAGSLLIPLVTIPSSWSFFHREYTQVIKSETFPIPPAPPSPFSPPEAGEVKAPPTPPVPTTTEVNRVEKQNDFFVNIQQWDWIKILWSIYSIGVAIFLVSFFIQFFVIILKKRKLESIQDGKYTIYELQNKSSPFSFFHWIFINPSLYDHETYNQILEHEKVHLIEYAIHDIDARDWKD